MGRAKPPNSSIPCPDCGCALDDHTGDEIAGPTIPFCLDCGRACHRATGTRFAAALVAWHNWDVKPIDVQMRGVEIRMILDALDLWQTRGCPTRESLGTQTFIRQKDVAALKERLWDAEQVIIRIHRGTSDLIRRRGVN